MDRIRIRGGNRLKGEIPISGAKNATLPLMAASLLTDAPLVLTNVPKLADVAFMADILRSLGATAEWEPSTAMGKGGRYRLRSASLSGAAADYDIVRKMRASFLVLGPLVARTGHARVSLPGGCAIGARPVDLHLMALKALGARVVLDEGYVIVESPGRLVGATIEFPFVSVGATENALMAAVLAEGETVLVNAAREPEIDDLGRCLIAMGARISGLGSSRIVVEGALSLRAAEHAVLPDRIETGTYAMAAAVAGGEVELTGTRAELIGALVPLLERVGTEIAETNRGLTVRRNGVRPVAVDVRTAPFPGFPTDLQAQFMALMSVSQGISRIQEAIFENRFMHVPELKRMGADIRIEGDTAIVRGVDRLKGAPVMATDLRASSSLVLAGLAAEGETIVNRVYHLDRGFERLEEKLTHVGADIERLHS
ncbi:MAG TPA: UDP-N-acetylglucosamine 1-carboxyvinyltransferase [Rhizomicrobium sp.]|jgi:UDP-N-acetylglucosamine 1-carboxyvinyltransferase|nr:UDP-N-acetylglucosamine 1-carboxyvinyltransferase [Rhizomicrobium sp.]